MINGYEKLTAHIRIFLIKHIQQTKPTVIGIYTNLMTKVNVVKLVQHLKSNNELKNIKLILGGPEVKHHAESFFKLWCRFYCNW